MRITPPGDALGAKIATPDVADLGDLVSGRIRDAFRARQVIVEVPRPPGPLEHSGAICPIIGFIRDPDGYSVELGERALRLSELPRGREYI